MPDWIQDNSTLLWWMVAASVLMFAGSLIALPAIVVRIRADYFAHEERPPNHWAELHPILRLAIRITKNVLGIVFALAGLAMLALPGQGLLTLAVGFLLVEFPGKYRVEKWLVGKRAVHQPINWLRSRSGREPIQIGEPD